jgi:hypothetical protein
MLPVQLRLQGEEILLRINPVVIMRVVMVGRMLTVVLVITGGVAMVRVHLLDEDLEEVGVTITITTATQEAKG